MSKYIVLPSGEKVRRDRFYKICKRAWQKCREAGREESAVIVAPNGIILKGAEVFA